MRLKTYHHLLITLITLLFQGCGKLEIQPKGLRTDLMRNPDYVGLYGKKQFIFVKITEVFLNSVCLVFK